MKLRLVLTVAGPSCFEVRAYRYSETVAARLLHTAKIMTLLIRHVASMPFRRMGTISVCSSLCFPVVIAFFVEGRLLGL
ncbi:MAG: hypothetical protein A3G80_01295 [Betaproteobacteria bacterium RIFCSPLOWO2_12_FULL_62_13b]|nr:MAG: hypothetical protein A3G80_01295 [Betaproteobacteria bacterium RIFCSPLOWO2_12_FULL_62_13b]